MAPSLPLGQFLYGVDASGAPSAFCNWAWLSPEPLEDVLAAGRDLRADEFRSGDRPLFYEFLSPFGHARQIVRRLREQPQFRGRRIPALRTATGGAAREQPRVGWYCF